MGKIPSESKASWISIKRIINESTFYYERKSIKQQRLEPFGARRVHPDLQYRSISVGLLDLLRLKTEPHRNTEDQRDAHVSEPGAFKGKEKIYQNTKYISSQTTRLVQNDLSAGGSGNYILKTSRSQ